MTVSLTLPQLAGLVALAVLLAVSDGAAISRLGVAWVAKRLGVEPGEVTKYDRATDGDGEGK